LEEGIPITDPAFYSCETLCPDSLIAHVFRPAPQSSETIPLLQDRISIMRQVGFILCAVSILISLSTHGRLIGHDRASGGLSKDSWRNFREEQIIKERRSSLYKWSPKRSPRFGTKLGSTVDEVRSHLNSRLSGRKHYFSSQCFSGNAPKFLSQKHGRRSIPCRRQPIHCSRRTRRYTF
jgi:hypothetical protein